MALSGGMVAALLGAVGVGGYLLYTHRKASGQSQCQKLVAGAASLGGYPTSDTLTKSVCDAASGILDAPSFAGAVSSLPGVQLATNLASKAVGAGPDANTCYQNGEGAPKGARYVSPGATVTKGLPIPVAVNGKKVCYVVFADQAGTKVVGLMLRGDKKMYAWKPAATAPRSPLESLGITATLLSASRNELGDVSGHTRDGQASTSGSGGVLVTSTPRK